MRTLGAKKEFTKTSEQPRRFTWEKNFVNQFDYNDYMAYHYAFMMKVASVLELEKNSEAAKDLWWVEAMNEEMQALSKNETWDLVPSSPHQKAIKCRWIFKVKHNVDDTINRCRARLVAKGYAQTHGVDYKETFAIFFLINQSLNVSHCVLSSIHSSISISTIHVQINWCNNWSYPFFCGRVLIYECLGLAHKPIILVTGSCKLGPMVFPMVTIHKVLQQWHLQRTMILLVSMRAMSYKSYCSELFGVYSYAMSLLTLF